MTALQFHPLADLFPLVEGAEFEELVADIKAVGRVELPIVIHEGMILDGRNRYRACMAAGIEPNFIPFRGDDPLGFVISLNLKRRHLDESQRAMVAAKLATLRQGARTDLSPIGEMSQQQAADLLNVGKRSVERAAEVRDHGAPELQQAVEQGKVSVSAAVDLATLPQQEQTEIVARGEREILRKAQEIRAALTEQRRVERIARAITLSARNAPLPAERKYPLLLADPAWRYDFSMTSTRAIEANYPTMSLEEICALPVSNLAAPSAVLFLWVPPAILEKGFAVIRAWGFSYATGGVWEKDKFGAGFYFRQQHEHLLVATRGDLPAPPPHARPSSIIKAPRGAHSEKPLVAYELIEAMYPELPKIELFARKARPGWDAWGNEAPPPVSEDDGLDIPAYLRRTAP
jgi:N6-adenosine-specific RNA methylase IME4